MQSGVPHHETPDPAHTPSAERAKDNQPQAALRPLASVVATLFLGVIAICIGVLLTPLMMVVGDYGARNSNHTFTGAAGPLWVMFAPIFPYGLLGVVVAVILRFSRKPRPVTLTAGFLSLLTCAFHAFSPMLKVLGEISRAKGLAEWPVSFAVLYWVVGVWVILMIVERFGPPSARKIGQLI